MERKYIQIQTTFEKRDEAVKLVEQILDARLVADGQISEIVSFYNWEGKRCESKEYLLTMKTRAELFSQCEAFIKKHHSYKVPQIIATKIKFGSQDYLDWIDENTKQNK
jgi:periplasmic divalent cation tolerance protein